MLSLEEKMRRCIQLAEGAAKAGNYALGALVVLDDEIIAESGSSLIADHDDPSAHPEMVVIRDAAKKIGSRHLDGAVLVTTLEPCPMCTSVAVWAKMTGVAFGATQEDAATWSATHGDEVYSWRQINIRARIIINAGRPRLALHENVLREECNRLFQLNGHGR